MDTSYLNLAHRLMLFFDGLLVPRSVTRYAVPLSDHEPYSDS